MIKGFYTDLYVFKQEISSQNTRSSIGGVDGYGASEKNGSDIETRMLKQLFGNNEMPYSGWHPIIKHLKNKDIKI